MEGEPARAVEADWKLELVRFRAGGFACALEARRVAGLRPAAGEGGAPWIETLLGLPPPERGAPRRRLLLRRPEGDLTLSVGDPVELRRIPAPRIHPLPPLLAARTTLRSLRALYLEEGELVLLLDAERLGDSIRHSADAEEPVAK